MERLRAALENMDQAIDGLSLALEKRNKEFDRVVEARANKRVKAATETAERALKQAQQKETQAIEKEVLARAHIHKQKEITGVVASRLDQAIERLEKMAGEK